MAMSHARKLLTIKRAARRHGLAPKWLYGVWGAETNLGQHATRVSSAGAQGDFQFMPATAESYGINPWRFTEAADAAAKYLAAYKGRGPEGMYRAYNAGPAGVDNPQSRAHFAAAMRFAKQWPGAKGKLTHKRAAKRGEVLGRKQSVDIQNVPTFDRQAYEDAARLQLVAQMIAKSRGTDSVLFRSGLLSTDAPSIGDFMDTELQSRVVKGDKVRAPGRGGGGKTGGKIHGGGGYSGTKAVADEAKAVASNMGVGVSSGKRSTKYTSSGNISDHWVGQKNTYAYDLDTPGIDVAKGHRLARRIARRLGVRYMPNNYASGGTFKAAGGKSYRVQILYGSGVGHGDHVHVGIRAL